jgi:hypothetical protein
LIDYFISRGWGKHLIRQLDKTPLPLVTTFYLPAFMAETFHYSKDIYCIVADVDVSRMWAPLRPEQSRIKYLVATHRVKEKLISYGVKRENIFLTGYPLQAKELSDLKFEFSQRLCNLDPSGIYHKQYDFLVDKYSDKKISVSNHPLSILFAATKKGKAASFGGQMIKSLKQQIVDGAVKIFISVGTNVKLQDYFLTHINLSGLSGQLGKNLEIIWSDNTDDYFAKFNSVLKTVDIIWSNPSELCFYGGWGIPLILTPPSGISEKINANWLIKSGLGLLQDNPKTTNKWLFEFLNEGWLAEAAMKGYLEIPKDGLEKIKEIIALSK